MQGEAHGAQKPECTQVHEDSEHRATMPSARESDLWGPLTVELVGFGLRRGKVQVAAVNRAAASYACTAFVFDGTQCFDVGHVRQAARGNHRNRQRLRELDGGLDVDATEHAVA